MTLAVCVLIYVAVLVFLIASAVRAVRYARLPVHLRWELYPIPHSDKPGHSNLWCEWKFMLPEMVFLKGLWEFNRGLWYRSFPFHFGLYLMIATLAILVPSALLGTAALHWCYTATGMAGWGLTMAGAAGLLHRRLTDPTLKNYSTPGDLFNLVFFLAAFGLLGAGYLLGGAGSPGVLALTRGVLTFDGSIAIPPLVAAGLVLGALLVAYIPLTHMSHFIAKYFTYHSIRWDDAPNRGQAELAKKIAEYLAYRPAWAAPHIGADGTKTWADIATTNPTAGKKK
ncbi:MAG: respiratory nitrate reductase subunit gamma [Acidobacteria bacterium]|nr:respiratory nitrate reductase subunit gamma [Acidobacteriota bacterium]